jgi:hypothetical protein
MPIGGERTGVQNPLIRYAKEASRPTYPQPLPKGRGAKVPSPSGEG